jgi:PAS domain S-box-containing protein
MGKERDRLTTDENQECKLARFCLDHASVCTLRLDQEGYILYANSIACESLGYLQAELLGMSVFDIDPVMDNVRWPDVCKTLCDVGTTAFESQHRRKDGTIFPVEVTATLIEFDDHRYFMAFINDITERKRIFESLRITQFIFDKAPLGIFLIRDGGDITNVNDHACQYLGYTREELCQMNVLEFDRGYSPQEIDQIWQRQRQKQVGGVDTFETIHRRKDGTDIPVEISGIRSEFDNVPYSVSFVKDISERKEAEKQRIKMEAQMRQAQKMESLGTLAGGIAHDFNNILGAILGYAELTQLKCPADSKIRNNVNQITRAGHRAKELVQQILLFSRQDRSEKAPMDVSRVVE